MAELTSSGLIRTSDSAVLININETYATSSQVSTASTAAATASTAAATAAASAAAASTKAASASTAAASAAASAASASTAAASAAASAAAASTAAASALVIANGLSMSYSYEEFNTTLGNNTNKTVDTLSFSSKAGKYILLVANFSLYRNDWTENEGFNENFTNIGFGEVDVRYGFQSNGDNQSNYRSNLTSNTSARSNYQQTRVDSGLNGQSFNITVLWRTPTAFYKTSDEGDDKDDHREYVNFCVEILNVNATKVNARGMIDILYLGDI